MPLSTAPIPCSRTPKNRFRPPSCPGPTWAAPVIRVLVEPPRSAEPPRSSGTAGASACNTVPDAARVASGSTCPAKSGSTSSHPLGNSPISRRSSSLANSGCATRNASSRSRHAASSVAPRSRHRRHSASASSGTVNGSANGHPRLSLVSRTSSSPSGAPCAAAVSCLFGLPYAMCVRTTRSDGRSNTSRAALSAWSRAARSFPSSTHCTCHP